jgi:hypothetical protein
MITIEEEVLIIKSIDFVGKKMLLVNLSNDRALSVPLSKFKELASLTERKKWILK